MRKNNNGSHKYDAGVMQKILQPIPAPVIYSIANVMPSSLNNSTEKFSVEVSEFAGTPTVETKLVENFNLVNTGSNYREISFKWVQEGATHTYQDLVDEGNGLYDRTGKQTAAAAVVEQGIDDFGMQTLTSDPNVITSVHTGPTWDKATGIELEDSLTHQVMLHNLKTGIKANKVVLDKELMVYTSKARDNNGNKINLSESLLNIEIEYVEKLRDSSDKPAYMIIDNRNNENVKMLVIEPTNLCNTRPSKDNTGETDEFRAKVSEAYVARLGAVTLVEGVVA